MDRPIYLDYNATTPVSAGALAAMLPFLREQFGNASSSHIYGAEAATALDAARSSVAGLIGALPDEIIFTAGGSETDNLAIKGSVLARLGTDSHIVSSATEHPAVLATLAYLRSRFGVAYTLVPVDPNGQISVAAVEAAIRPNTVLVTLMHANNETGTIQPVHAIGALTSRRGILFHVDAAQSAGKVPIDVRSMGIDLLTLAGHKLYAPKGIGALFVRRGVQIDPLIHGSGQERGRRAGTENVASIVAFGVAAAEAAGRVHREAVRLLHLRDLLHSLLSDAIPALALNGHPDERLPNTLNVSFPGISGNALLAYAPGVAASTGSACHSGLDEPSPVLLAMGHSPERAVGAVRLSLGHDTGERDIRLGAERIIAAYRTLTAEHRSVQPVL